MLFSSPGVVTVESGSPILWLLLFILLKHRFVLSKVVLKTWCFVGSAFDRALLCIANFLDLHNIPCGRDDEVVKLK